MTSNNDRVVLERILESRRNEYNSDTKSSDYFEIFSVEEILKEKNLSIDEIESLVIDGSRDGGIDSIAIFINDRLVSSIDDLDDVVRQNVNIEIFIIQSSLEEGFKEKKIQAMFCTISELLDLEKDLQNLRGRYNLGIIDSFGLFQEAVKRSATKYPSISFGYFYAAMSVEPAHQNVVEMAKKVEEETKKFFPNSNTSFRFLGCGEMLKSASKRKKISHQIKVSEVMPVDNAYVCLVDLKNYYQFLMDEDNNQRINSTIFEQNVRDYEGDVNVNVHIRDTLNKPSSEDFWWLNNGVTIIASQANCSGKMLTIEDPQIVNGQQTSNEIFLFLREKKSNEVDDKKILVRVIKSDDEAVRSKIIKATNFQTSIPPAQLYATDPIHHLIEQFFLDHGLFYEKRKNFYRNQNKSPKDIISISYLAQCVMTVLLQKPHEARARPYSLMRKTDIYKEIFSDKIDLEVFLKIAKIAKAAKRVLAKIKSNYEGISNIFFHTILYSVIKALGTSDYKAKDLKSINLEIISDSFLEESFKEVFSATKTTCDLASKDIEQLSKNSESTNVVLGLAGQIQK
jgi:hypothetical protein